MNISFPAIILCASMIRASEYENFFDGLDSLVKDPTEDLAEGGELIQTKAYTQDCFDCAAGQAKGGDEDFYVFFFEEQERKVNSDSFDTSLEIKRAKEELKLVDGDEGLYYYGKFNRNRDSIFADTPAEGEGDDNDDEEELTFRNAEEETNSFDFEKYKNLMDSIFENAEEEMKECNAISTDDTTVEEVDLVEYYRSMLPNHVNQFLLGAALSGRSLDHLKPYLDKYVELSSSLRDLQSIMELDREDLSEHESKLAELTKQRVAAYDRWLATERPPPMKALTGSETNVELREYDIEIMARIWIEQNGEKKLFRPSPGLAQKTETELSWHFQLEARIKLMEAFEGSLLDVFDQLFQVIEKESTAEEDDQHTRELSYFIRRLGLQRKLLAPLRVESETLEDIEVICDEEAPEYSAYRTEACSILCWSEELSGEYSVYTESERMVVQDHELVACQTVRITVPVPDPEALHAICKLSSATMNTINEIIFQQLAIAALFGHPILLVDLAAFRELGFTPGAVSDLYRNWAAKFNMLELRPFSRIVLCNYISYSSRLR